MKLKISIFIGCVVFFLLQKNSQIKNEQDLRVKTGANLVFAKDVIKDQNFAARGEEKTLSPFELNNLEESISKIDHLLSYLDRNKAAQEFMHWDKKEHVEEALLFMRQAYKKDEKFIAKRVLALKWLSLSQYFDFGACEQLVMQMISYINDPPFSRLVSLDLYELGQICAKKDVDAFTEFLNGDLDERVKQTLLLSLATNEAWER